eukprot:TRINITY_DN3022_c0_g1_i3.p1 TRINITY_DN3022_c0_g1~~TRINITY_DN3022_c0_g1_i3.p1  ORF type:complete len:752 (-),score=181.03 TRINITY_DN3022_c0_g1_i3:565-2820(-)
MEPQSVLQCFEQGKHSEAIKFCDDFIEKNPHNPFGYCNRAAASYHLELFRRCIKDCDAALKLDSTFLRAYLRKGLALTSMGKKEEARKVWTQGQAAATSGSDIDLYMELKRCLMGELPSSKASIDLPQTPLTSNSISADQTPVGVNPSFSVSARSGALQGGEEESDSERSNYRLRLGSSDNGPKELPMGYDSAAASAAVAAQGIVQHGVGNKEIDEKIALGYLHVNTGNYVLGMDIFTTLLKKNPQIVAAYLGKGTAHALMGDLDSAVADFSAAITLNPSLVDAWKRRGQTRAAKGNDTEAIADLTRAIQLDEKDAETHHQRGLVYYKQRNYKRALADFKKASSIDKMNKLTWNHLGLCLTATGYPVEAIDAYARAMQIDSKFREGWVNMAQAYKDLGVYDKAEQLFEKAISIDPTYLNSYHMRAMTHFGVGNHKLALVDFTKALKVDPKHLDSLCMRGVVNHGLGIMKAAVEDYSACVAIKADHVAWYQREVALFVHHHLDTPMSQFNIDVAMDKYFKESWCKRNHPATLPKYQQQPPYNKAIPDVSANPKLSAAGEEVINKFVRRFGPRIQNNAAGYMPNKRQYAMTGLSMLDLAQRLKELWKKNQTTVDGKSSSGSQEPHEFGWRDMYDVIIKWRQLSEPNDPVWWVDLLSPEQFEEGFGSHTPMLTGQTQVIRYYPMFSRSFPIMKELMPAQCNLTEDQKREVQEAKDCKAMYDIMRRDFWVCTPCHSTATPGKIMEGTRLTLQVTE